MQASEGVYRTSVCEVFSPDRLSPHSWILTADLAESEEVETSLEGLEQLRGLWVKEGLPIDRVDWGHDSDEVYVTGNRDDMLTLAILAHEVARSPLTRDEEVALECWLRDYTRPPAPEIPDWEAGVVAALDLGNDHGYAFFQLLGFTHSKVVAPRTFALFAFCDYHSNGMDVDPEEVVTSRTVAILAPNVEGILDLGLERVGSCALCDLRPPAELSATAATVPLPRLAKAWFGVEAWDEYLRSPFVMNEALLPGVRRPDRTWLRSDRGL